MAMSYHYVPGVADKLAAKQMDRQHYEEPPRDTQGALFQASEASRGGAGQVRGSGGVVNR